MALTQRAYSNEADKHLMSALARRCSESSLHVVDLPYRLSSWAFDEPENIRLWFDENRQLAAWAALQSPFWTVDDVCAPEHEPDLHPEILSWADRRAKAVQNSPYGRAAWFVMVFDGQTRRIRDLESAGFTCQADVGDRSWSKVLMRRSSRAPVSALTPPAGFNVRSLAGEEEVPDYVELHQSVFESKNMTEAWRARTLQHPDYRPDLDIVVEAPDRRLVAFCICWFDAASLTGQVEPLGSHRDFRRAGFGRIALAEGLRRLQALGARNILVETDDYRDAAFNLYQSFGFEVVRNVLVYRKD